MRLIIIIVVPEYRLLDNITATIVIEEQYYTDKNIPINLWKIEIILNIIYDYDKILYYSINITFLFLIHRVDEKVSIKNLCFIISPI